MFSIKLSIITVCYNDYSGLTQTVNSLIPFKDSIQHIIIDGGSTDQTVEMFSCNKNNDYTFISESDDGIYDAMNKGLSLAKGEWVYFLNAGDILLLDCNELINLLQTKKSIISFPIVYDDGSIFIPKFNWHILLNNTLHHQGTIYKKKLFLTKYNTSYQIYADYDFNLKLFLSDFSVEFHDKVISCCDSSGISHNSSFVCYKESLLVKRNNLKVFDFYIFSFLYTAKYGCSLLLKFLKNV